MDDPHLEISDNKEESDHEAEIYSIYVTKPAKYGIKVWWLSDAENGYLLKGIICTDKVGNTHDVNQGEKIVKELAVAYIASGRNISMDRFFTTLPFTKLLLTWNPTLVGTLQKIKVIFHKKWKRQNQEHHYQHFLAFMKNLFIRAKK